MKKITILTFNQCYLPGYKAGGPIVTISNMVDALGDEFAFKIVTSDRDFTDEKEYMGITVDTWNKIGKADVFYCSPKNQSVTGLRKIICNTPHDILYLNSFFNPTFTITPLLLRRLNLIPRIPTILAPRGEFSPGALRLKWLKKKIYIELTKLFKLYHGLIWQASSVMEKSEICQGFDIGDAISNVFIAPDLVSKDQINENLSISSRLRKTPETLNIILLSRIAPKKNLDSALKMLNDLKGHVYLNIYGHIDDLSYWKKCQETILSLPPNIKVEYKGAIPHEQVSAVMSKHDLFFLPTLGENFGHVIIEALSAGCPVLISDQTPWHNLERTGIGWDLPLQCPEKFRSVLQKCVDMDESEFVQWSRRAYNYAQQYLTNDNNLYLNRDMFLKANHMNMKSTFGEIRPPN